MKHLVDVLGGHPALGVVIIVVTALLLAFVEVLRLSPLGALRGRWLWWTRLAAVLTLLSLLMITAHFLADTGF